jgi:hypothetical protein
MVTKSIEDHSLQHIERRRKGARFNDVSTTKEYDRYATKQQEPDRASLTPSIPAEHPLVFRLQSEPHLCGAGEAKQHHAVCLTGRGQFVSLICCSDLCALFVEFGSSMSNLAGPLHSTPERGE